MASVTSDRLNAAIGRAKLRRGKSRVTFIVKDQMARSIVDACREIVREFDEQTEA